MDNNDSSPSLSLTITSASPLARSFWSDTATFWIAGILLLAPLKLGAVIDAAGVGFYPLFPLEWLFMSWPPLLSTPLATGALILVLIASRGHIPVNSLRRGKHLLLPSLGLLIAALLGSLATTEKEYALRFLWHLLAIVNFGLAIAIHLINFPASRSWLLIAVVVGTGLSACSGLYQVFYGFAETREMAYEMAQQHQQTLSPEMLSRLNQTRAFSAFTYPNIYAAHLILTIPLTLMSIWLVSVVVSPPFLSQLVFTGLMAMLTISALLATGSRGAVIAILLAGMVLAGWRWQPLQLLWKNHRVKFQWAVGLIFIIGGLMLLVVSQGRTLSSLFARMDYYTTAAKIFGDNPWWGAGMGEFFPYYLRFKPPNAEETRLAHSIFFHFLSQCGLLGGMAVIYFIAQPFILLYLMTKKVIKPYSLPLFNAAIWGGLAWNLHALTDFNEQIPGTMLLLTALPILTVEWEFADERIERSALAFLLLSVIIVLGLLPLTRLPGEKAYQQLYNLAQSHRDLNVLQAATLATSRLMPLSPYPWELLGRSALEHRDYLLAEQAYTEAIYRSPHRAPYHAYLARCHQALGNLPDAIASMKTALFWYPHHQEFQHFSEQLNQQHPR